MSDHRSSVLLDVATDSPEHADTSEEALGNARREGGLIINECVLAEIRPAFRTGEFDEFLADWQLKFVPSPKKAPFSPESYSAATSPVVAEPGGCCPIS